ncbi:hypothetical protein VNO78_18561 [Psophocarpus tetragonolobus]|uniref:C2 domain-containing protein n=1 Tax=Psophocarpus tetragonolobus TaxID=3891 RepID=A0AAN9XMB0_PSOTE
MGKKDQVLEINLISAQGLKPPSSPRRSLQTYAVTWIDPATKLRTRVDKLGAQNPTWNDKFLFRVTPHFLAGDTSSVCVAIYAVGTFRDHLVGTVRFLISNMLSPEADYTSPCFSAFQIRRPSGRFHGVMNIGAMLMDASGFPALEKTSAIGYRDLMGEKLQPRPRRKNTPKDDEVLSSDSCTEEEADSSTPSPLKDWNRLREFAGTRGLTMSASGFLCCLVTQRTVPQQLTPTNPTLDS